MNLPIRIAVIGASRGQTFVESAAALPGQIKLAAICDTRAEALAPWRGRDEIRLYSDFQHVLEDPEIDAVCIATPLKLHARQSIAALQAGKHVLSEVTAAWTLDECRNLIEAVERSGLSYMMAENCCYFRHVLMVQNMVEAGVFGELIHAQGSYIHSIPEMNFDADDNVTWRGELRRDEWCNAYPTHSFGPVCKWLGVNESDRLKTTATWHSGAYASADYVARTRGENYALADAAAWSLPDKVTTMARTEKGILIEHSLDFVSPRPHNMNCYSLQGTRAAFSSNISPNLEPLVWIEGRSPTSEKGVPISWEPLFNYADEWEHPLWREHGEVALKAGHGGADYFTLREFAGAIIEGRPPYVDAYDAVTWSSISPLSALSMQNNNAPVEVPDWKASAPK